MLFHVLKSTFFDDRNFLDGVRGEPTTTRVHSVPGVRGDATSTRVNGVNGVRGDTRTTRVHGGNGLSGETSTTRAWPKRRPVRNIRESLTNSMGTICK